MDDPRGDQSGGMTPGELWELCADHASRGLDVQLVVPQTPRGRRVRLFGRAGPLSREVACVTERGTVAWWDPAKVRAWLEREFAEVAALEQRRKAGDDD